MAIITACSLLFYICADDCRHLKHWEVRWFCDLLSGMMWVSITTTNHKQSQLHTVLRNPVPHLKRQMQRLRFLVEEMLQHGEIHGSVEV
jgi:hypothetical protein